MVNVAMVERWVKICRYALRPWPSYSQKKFHLFYAFLLFVENRDILMKCKMVICLRYNDDEKCFININHILVNHKII